MKPDWARIREHYRMNAARTRDAGARTWGLDPYAWDHEAGITLTPIEAWAWADIRRAGLVMYPQFPVGRYFVDFANPAAKVAIECDGAAFHQDAGRDAGRQANIEAAGWVVYRISGAVCRTDAGMVEDEHGRERHVESECYALIREIGNRHGLMPEPYRMGAA